MSKAKDITPFLPTKPVKPAEHKFVLRLPPDLWAQIVREAKRLQVSANAVLIAAAKAAVGGK